jgi:uncharacterized protein YndB with AHSA1/START domain
MTGARVTIVRRLAADIGRVWEAWCRPELLARWLVCAGDGEASVDADVTVGGRYRVEMRLRDGRRPVVSGEYMSIEKPRRLVFTWTNEALGVRDSVVTVELRPTGEGATEITITHALAPESEAGRRHARGWEGSLDNLARHLASSVAEAR